MKKLLLSMAPEDAQLIRNGTLTRPPDCEVDMVEERSDCNRVTIRLAGEGLPCGHTPDGGLFPDYDYKIIRGDWPPVLKLIPRSAKKRSAA